MSIVLKVYLISHVLLGVVGTMCYYVVWRDMFKRQLSFAWLQYTSLIGWISFILSWLVGGYYYVKYYGGVVKPIIKSGQYPWAHTLIMEAKEHIFLFLPVLSTVVMLTLFLLKEPLQTNEQLKRNLAALSGIITVLGIALALGGIVISGAAR